jgi:hypothetical protein
MINESAAMAALFVCGARSSSTDRPAAFRTAREPHTGCDDGSIVGLQRLMLQGGMVLDRHQMAHQRGMRIVLDDRSRLPWRFFGRLTTAALAA